MLTGDYTRKSIAGPVDRIGEKKKKKKKKKKKRE